MAAGLAAVDRALEPDPVTALAGSLADSAHDSLDLVLDAAERTERVSARLRARADASRNGALSYRDRYVEALDVIAELLPLAEAHAYDARCELGRAHQATRGADEACDRARCLLNEAGRGSGSEVAK
jgi:hypothetical protein